LEATAALGRLTTGLRVNDILTNSPNIGGTMGGEFDQSEVRFEPPDTMAFRGQARIRFTKPSALGGVAVQGQPGYELRVTKRLRLQREAELQPIPVQDEASWFERNEETLAAGAIITVVLVAAILLTPATGGGSLVPIFAAAL
jgi:hypothetical protein